MPAMTLVTMAHLNQLSTIVIVLSFHPLQQIIKAIRILQTHIIIYLDNQTGLIT